MKYVLILAVFFFGLVTFPVFAVTATDTPISLASYAGCTGVDCSACNLVHLANGLIVWLIGFLCLLCAVILAYAGFGLLTSGGNPGALDEAKSKFTNALIGMLIVLSAWLVVDTIMRGLVGDATHDGQVNQVTGWLYWTQVQCQEQTAPDKFEEWVAQLVTYWPGDPSSQFSNSQVVSLNSCAPTPAGNVNCTALINACTAAGNFPVVDKTNPTDHQVQCTQVIKSDPTPITGGGSSGCSGGACVPLTIPCSASGCNIAPDMVTRLAAMHNTAGVAGARVTEAMPASRVHKNACHQNGTCIDYSKAGGMSADEVIRVINAAKSNGLRPVYEVITQAQKNALVTAGAPASSIMVLGNWISAPHFSIYGN